MIVQILIKLYNPKRIYLSGKGNANMNNKIALLAIIFVVFACGSAHSTELRLAEHYHDGHDHGYGEYPYVGVAIGVPLFFPEHYVESPKHTPAKILTMKVQVELTSLGYYDGAVDGRSGSRTTAAIVAFQKDQGLPVTGNIDAATLDALGIRYTTKAASPD